jgi:hypothetical protein
VVEMEFNHPPVKAEDYEDVTPQKIKSQKLENNGEIYLSINPPQPSPTYIFLLRKEKGKYKEIEKIETLAVNAVFTVKIGYNYKIIVKKEGFFPEESKVLVIDTPEQTEIVTIYMATIE